MADFSRRSFFAGATALLALSGCDLRSKNSYRYRITIEVDTPQGLRSGSSVWETTAWEGSGIPDRGIRTRTKGEAVAVDLPGGTLFVPRRGADMDVDYPSGLVPSHLYRHPQPGISVGTNWVETRQAIARAKPEFELYPDEYPLLVRFRDLKDPMSVERLDPTALDEAFGTSVKLRRIVVSVTDDTVSTGIVHRIAWLPAFHNKNLDGGKYISSNILTSNLGGDDFSTDLN